MFLLQNISIFGGYGNHSKKGADLFLKNLKHCLFFNGLYLFLQMEKPFKTTYRYPCMSNLFRYTYVNKIQIFET